MSGHDILKGTDLVRSNLLGSAEVVPAVAPRLLNLTDRQMDRAPRVVGGGWTRVILQKLRAEPCRFNALRRRNPAITQWMLPWNLREQEVNGFIARGTRSVVRPPVHHAPTPMRQCLMPVMLAMADRGAAGPVAATEAAA